jgi:hypothetical protein
VGLRNGGGLVLRFSRALPQAFCLRFRVVEGKEVAVRESIRFFC